VEAGEGEQAMKNFKRAMLTMSFALLLTGISAWAQDEPPSQDEPPVPDQQQVQDQAPSRANQPNQPDPPGRAARLQYMSGQVSVQPRGTEDWVAGTLNRPLTISDNIWTDKESRAELNVGTGVFRMGDETSLTLTNVSDNSVQVELHQGTLDLHVRHLFGGEIYEVDTPNLAFTIQKSGVYRIDVDPNGDATVVTVRKGEGDATGQGPAVRVRSNEQVKFTDGTSLTHTVAEAPPYDGFDGWCAVRDKREDSSLSARYVAPGTVGAEDLDDYGVWREEPPYGPVWVPTVAPGWAPYQFGHWIWVEPWGWTWVDDAPWGYAPFHYGRWVYGGGYWGWAPGPVYVRPVYAPALVAWFGGPGWGLSLGFGFGGGFGWCPLGWGEPFFPWYHAGFGYFRGVNISNTRIVNINRYWGHPPDRFGAGGFHYANLRAPGGITTAPMRSLQNGAAIRGSAVRVSEHDLAGAPMGRVGMAPTRNAILGAHAGQPAAAPPMRSAMRPVVSHMTPPASFNRANGTPMRAGVNNNKPFAGRPAMGSPEMNRGASPQFNRNVPRPPTNMAQNRAPQMGSGAPARGGFGSPAVGQHSVPRPPTGFHPSPSAPARTESRASTGSFGNPPNTSVPRPTGPVRPASQSDRFGGNSGYGRSPNSSPANRGGFGNSPRYSAPSNRGSGPSYGGSAPSYRGGMPSYRGGSTPSYGGGRSYGGGGGYRASAPSYHGGGGAPSYHGGGGAPSYHGGGGGGSSHGGGGGGGHSSGGGHGGHR
jgi:hypothetical protein